MDRVFTIPEAAARARVGVSTYYRAARRGEVPAVRIGRRLVVPEVLLMRFLGGGDAMRRADRGQEDGRPGPEAETARLNRFD